MTVTDKDLFLAILAKVSHNRSYDPDIKYTGDDDPDGLGGGGSQIGHATVIGQSDAAPGAPGVAAGFFAVA